VGADASVQCGRVPDGMKPGQQHNGHIFLKLSDKDPQFGVFRGTDDPVLKSRDEGRRREWEDRRRRLSSNVNGTVHHGQNGTAARLDVEVQAEALARNLTPQLRAELAATLRLPERVLTQLRHVGYSPTGYHAGYYDQPCYTFPEVDDQGRLVGVGCRYPDGKKKAMPGTERGLTVPEGWDTGEGPVFAVEGPSDTLAALALNLSVIGRPSCTGGADDLAGLLKGLPPGRDIIVVGEMDPKPDGAWPGRDGAAQTAARLAELLGRPVKWALPPDGAKDVRAWTVAQQLPADCLDSWHAAGEQLSGALAENAQVIKPPAGGCNGHSQGPHPVADPIRVVTTSLACIDPEPIHWLVPGYVPLGKLVLLAGDGGHGKSTLTLKLAADLTRGRPCLGLDYQPLPQCEVLLIGCEDDYADTVVPRLLAADADRKRVFKLDGVRGDDGKVLPFSLAHYEAMERELEARPDIRLVVIDPAGAYIGRAGINDHKDSELRSLLDPMAELAARRRVTIILVKHLNKGASPKAVHKVSGSTGYVNAVRAAYVVAPSQEEESVKLLLPLKFNIGLKPSGLSYCLETIDWTEGDKLLAPFERLGADDQRRLREQLFRVRWLGEVTTDADSLFAAAAREAKAGPKVKACMEWIMKFLATYAYSSDEIVKAAKDEGFTFDNVKVAKNQLKEKGLNNSNRATFQGNWWSGFGDPLTWKLRPESPDSPRSPQSPHSPDNGQPPPP
jgi:hypothetical protein